MVMFHLRLGLFETGGDGTRTLSLSLLFLILLSTLQNYKLVI